MHVLAWFRRRSSKLHKGTNVTRVLKFVIFFIWNNSLNSLIIKSKHLDYESKLIECILHIPRNLQNISTTTITPGTTTTTTNVENSNTNQLGFIPQTNTVIPGTTTAAATALTTATSSSVSIIPPPATSTTPPIVQNSVSPVSNLTTNTVTHTSSTSNTNNQENKGESIKSKYLFKINNQYIYIYIYKNI